MAEGILVVLVALCVSTSCTTLEQPGPQLQCQAPNISNVKVVLRTQQNSTGHWISRVGVKQRMDSVEGRESDHWMVDVEQNTETCEDEGSVLETVFFLSAPPSTRGRPSQRSPTRSVPTTTPIDWVCPRCPPPTACPTCPTCPPPTTCPTSPPTPKSAPPGYERFVGLGYYKVSPRAETWLDAKRICEQDGGHLAILNSQTEADAIKTLLTHFPSTPGAAYNDYVYLGAQLVGTKYITVLGDDLANTGYARWNTNEPSGRGESCLSLIRSNNLFNDVGCTSKYGFICEHLNQA